MSEYYDGTKLLSMKDINGKTPEIYICTSNRSGGKTTYFNRLAMNRYFKGTIRKFCLLYRYNYELTDIDDKFFKDINTLFFPDYVMTSKKRANGVFCELFIQNKKFEDIKPECCGYAISLNNADQLKKYSHLLSDVDMIIFDEFMSENNNYCQNELQKFISIHTSIARGQSKQVRYVPVFMISNPVSIINPYYTELGISSRLKHDTHFLKGNGFVLEQGFVKSASEKQKDSIFNKAFAGNDYIAYSSECIYLNDSLAFIERPSGNSRYICTLRYENHDYGVREYADDGLMYCDSVSDTSYPLKIAVTTDDHNINYVMLNRNLLILTSLRNMFELGCFRFKDLKCKEALMTAISYR